MIERVLDLGKYLLKLKAINKNISIAIYPIKAVWGQQKWYAEITELKIENEKDIWFNDRNFWEMRKDPSIFRNS